MEKISCFTRGEALGDPGPAMAQVCVLDESGRVLHDHAQSIGNSRADYAAYHAVLLGLQTVSAIMVGTDMSSAAVEIWIEHESVFKQLSHQSPVTDPALVPLFMAIHNIRVEQIGILTYRLGARS